MKISHRENRDVCCIENIEYVPIQCCHNYVCGRDFISYVDLMYTGDILSV